MPGHTPSYFGRRPSGSISRTVMSKRCRPSASPYSDENEPSITRELESSHRMESCLLPRWTSLKRRLGHAGDYQQSGRAASFYRPATARPPRAALAREPFSTSSALRGRPVVCRFQDLGGSRPPPLRCTNRSSDSPPLDLDQLQRHRRGWARSVGIWAGRWPIYRRNKLGRRSGRRRRRPELAPGLGDRGRRREVVRADGE
jgi:hypothetical protein